MSTASGTATGIVGKCCGACCSQGLLGSGFDLRTDLRFDLFDLRFVVIRICLSVTSICAWYGGDSAGIACVTHKSRILELRSFELTTIIFELRHQTTRMLDLRMRILDLRMHTLEKVMHMQELRIPMRELRNSEQTTLI
jgi:hypothetical protein